MASSTTFVFDNRPAIRSNWPRQAILGPLTDRRILEYARQGRYGAKWQAIATARALRLSLTRTGTPIQCQGDGCTIQTAVKFVRYAYLPKAGWYCPACVAKFRYEHDKDRILRQQWRELVKREYV